MVTWVPILSRSQATSSAEGPHVWIDRLDRAAEDVFVRLRGRPWADRLFYTASDLGDFSLLWHLLAAARALRSDRDLAAGVRLSVSAVAESFLVNGAFKSLFRRKRPIGPIAHPRHLRQPLTSSFPSGHTTAAFSALIVLGEDDPWVALYALAALVVSASRIHVGMHHASDVLGGAVLGCLFGLAVRRLVPLPVM
ncbi:MAG: phosphatase PAP2 family protein [Acidimicrobiales bacterium]